MQDFLLCIDLQNVYLKGEEWGCVHSSEALANIKRLLSSGMPAAFTQFLPPEKPEGAWREYNRVNSLINADSRLNDIIEDFKPFLGKYPLYTKSVYSSLLSSGVREAVRGYGRVVLTGFVAECCVLSTLLSAVDLGIPFIYLHDAVSGLTERSEAETLAIASYFTPVHGVVMSTEEYLAGPV